MRREFILRRLRGLELRLAHTDPESICLALLSDAELDRLEELGKRCWQGGQFEDRLTDEENAWAAGMLSRAEA